MAGYTFEQLESRLLLAASVKLKNNGTLLIKGDNADDVVEITGTGDAGVVRVGTDTDGNGTADKFEDFTGVKNIQIRTAGGNDTVTIDGINLEGQVKISTGKGDDFLSVADTTLGGRLSFNGQQGDDTYSDLGGNSFGKEAKLRYDTLIIEETDRGELYDLPVPTPADDYFSTADNVPIYYTVMLNDFGDEILPLFYLLAPTTNTLAYVSSISSGNQSDSIPELVNGEFVLQLTTAGGGTVEMIQYGGEFFYTPPAVADGTFLDDSFTYTLTNLNGESASAVVRIRVNGTAAPVVGDDSYVDSAALIFNESGTGQTSAYNLLSNDGGATKILIFESVGPTDEVGIVAPGQSIPIYVYDDSNALGLAEGDLLGTVSISATGVLTFNADPSLAGKLTAGEWVTAMLHYEIDRGFNPMYDLSGDGHAEVEIRINGAG